MVSVGQGEMAETLRNKIPFMITPTHIIRPTHIVNPTHTKAFLHCLACTGVAVQLMLRTGDGKDG